MRKLNHIDIKYFSFAVSVDGHLKEKTCLRANIRFCRTVTRLTKRGLAGVLRPAFGTWLWQRYDLLASAA